MAKSGNRNKFKQAFVAKTKGAWSKAKNAEVVKRLNVPDGQYVGQLSGVVFDLDKNQNPYVRFNIVLVSNNEDYNNQVTNRSHFLSKPKNPKNRDGSAARTLEEKLEDLAKDLKRLDIDTDESDMSDIDNVIDACEKLAKKKPFIKFTVKARIDRETGEVDHSADPNIYINGLARDEEIPDTDDQEFDNEDDDAEVDTDEESEDDSEPEDDDTEESDDDSEDGDSEGEESDDEDGDEPPDDYDDESDSEESEESEDDDSEEEEEPPKPSRSAGKKTKPAAKPAGKPAAKPPKKIVAQAKVQYKGKPYTVKSVAGGKAVLIGPNKQIIRNVPVADLK